MGRFEVLAIGGFLGQLDGFCENPGGTYDLAWLEEHKALAQGCPTADGNGPLEPGWRVAFGGVLGAGTWLASHTTGADSTRLVVITGNNQVPNFGALGDKALEFLDPRARAAALRSSPSSADAAPRQAPAMIQAQARLAQFWEELARLSPTIVGLGREDFVRSLRATDSLPSGTGRTTGATPASLASVFAQFIEAQTNSGRGLPLVASNAVIKLRTLNRSLNVVEADGAGGRFSLANIDEHESVDWLDAVTVNHPPNSLVRFTLCEGSDQHVCTSAPANAAATSTKLAAPGGALRPGTEYEVRIGDGEALSFRTHRALTPRVTTDAAFNGFPVVAQQWLANAPLLLVSLVDPDAKTLLGEQAWTWSGTDCPDHSDECEIAFMAPATSLRALLRRSLESRKQKPFVVLVSDLADSDTQALMEAYPEIRVTILPPDSGMLGRASRASARPGEADDVVRALSERLPGPKEDAAIYGGDLGFSSIVNQDVPVATGLVVRPEWIGETGARAQATVRYTQRDEWTVEGAQANLESVPGPALSWRTGYCREDDNVFPCVSYKATWAGESYEYGTYRAYEDCALGSASDRCARFFDLVTNTAVFNAVAGDLLRRATRAELALVPAALLDLDFGLWLRDLLIPPPLTAAPASLPATNFLSRFMLERAIYRSLRFVRATVSGDKLLTTLKSIVDRSGTGSCILGIGAQCVESVNVKAPETVLVNGRTLDPRLYYSIAVPDSLAESFALEHSDSERASHDAVAALHDGVASNHWYMPPGRTPLSGGDLAGRITWNGDRRRQWDVIASTLEVGYNWLSVGKPSERGDVLQGLDVDFRNTTPAQNWIVKTNVDVAVIDMRRWAVRLISALDFNRRKDIERDPPEYAYTANTLSYGARWDVIKVRPLNRELRPYVGWFTERALKGPNQYLNAAALLTRTAAYTESRTATGRTLFTVPALRYEYLAAGADLMIQWKALPLKAFELDVTRLGVQRARGDLVNLPTGIEIAEIVQTRSVFDTYLTSGAKKVVGDYYLAHLDSFDPATTFKVIGGRERQKRWQFDVSTEARLKLKSRTYRLTTEIGYRYYTGISDDAPLRLHHALKSKAALVLPFVWRLELAPTMEYQWAKIRAAENNIFESRRFEILLRFPFVARGGWGRLFH